MSQYRKKPVVIDAMQWSGDFTDAEKILAFADVTGGVIAFNGNMLVVYTLHGPMRAMPNDWLIRGVNGEIYPCKPEVFAKTYEPVEQT